MTIRKRYSTFTADRPEYWALLLVLYVLQAGLGALMLAQGDGWGLLGIVIIAAYLTLIAARCRDAGLNGWWCLAAVIPLAMLYFGCIRPDNHPKKLRAFEKLRVNEPNALDLPAPKARKKEHELIDIPHSKGEKA